MITSMQNDKVKQWKKLQTKKTRVSTGTFLVEGYHLVEEARKSAWAIKEIIVQENTPLPNWCNQFDVITVSKHVFNQLTQTKTPQGIIAVVYMLEPTPKYNSRVLLVDGVQDPGNLGTIIRTADAAGFNTIILGNDTVDMYNDKVIRATQGSLFHIPIIRTDLSHEIIQLKEFGFSIWASALQNAKPYDALEINQKTALIVGNEGSGIKDEIIQLADTLVKIPIYGQAESLNVSVAAGILMYYLQG